MSKILGTASRRRTNSKSSLSVLYAPIASDMAAVEDLLRAELQSEYPYVDELIRYGCLLGGKRLRPALLLLAGRAFGPLRREHTVLAAVVEMIHTATLVHDDVLDEADKRRHLATVNARWDCQASVLLGDFLFTHAFYLASTLESTWACRQIGRATNIVCEGEMRQKGCRGDFSLDEAGYLGIIEAKTAELCACSCQLGAHYGGASEEMVASMANFGRHLGTAFQIVDDVLDLMGDETATGKSLGTDLEQQKPTLPVIRALSLASPDERETIVEILRQNHAGRHDRLAPFLRRYEATEYALERAGEYVRLASRELQQLPGSAVREQLARLADFVLTRIR